MSKIRILPETLINKIAAGEVVERPASVVKELIENAVDAGCDQIFVTINNGGKDYISVLDNGGGMSAEDAKLAVERHATSKIADPDDLENIQTLGFRGEALAAIAAVSRFELTTCGDETEGGFQIRVEGGKLMHSARIGFPSGTRVVVENLFYNTPARQKFMKSANTEYQHIHQLILQMALARPEIQFRLIHNKHIVLNAPKGQDFGQRVQHCFGEEIRRDLVECDHQEPYLSFTGLVSHPSGTRASKRWQHVFINDRYVRSGPIRHSVYEGYKTLLMKGMHPIFFLKLCLSPAEIDVNVHPAKTEIRLKNPNLIHTILSEQIARTLKRSSRQQIYHPVPPGQGEQPRSPIDGDRLPKGEADPRPDPNRLFQPFVELNQQIGFDVPDTPAKPAPIRSAQPQKPSDAEHPPASSAEAVPIEPEPAPAEDSPFSFSGRTEERPEIDFSAGKDSPHRAIGQLFEKYILAQGENSLLLIDQHAAHERIRFEEIRRQFYADALTTQTLLIPMMMELPPQDGLLLDQHLASFEKLGFLIDHFGGNDYAIKEIPAIVKNCDVPAIIRDVLDEMAQFGKSGRLETFFNEVFERMACHSAIRASQKLTLQEMQALLNQLNELDIQLHCPHGRPVITEIPMAELDKRFKR